MYTPLSDGGLELVSRCCEACKDYAGTPARCDQCARRQTPQSSPWARARCCQCCSRCWTWRWTGCTTRTQSGRLPWQAEALLLSQLLHAQLLLVWQGGRLLGSCGKRLDGLHQRGCGHPGQPEPGSHCRGPVRLPSSISHLSCGVLPRWLSSASLCRDTSQLVYVPGSTVTSNEVIGTVPLTPSTLYVLLILGPDDVYVDEFIPVELAYAAHPEGSASAPSPGLSAVQDAALRLM